MARNIFILLVILSIGCNQQPTYVDDVTIQNLSEYKLDQPFPDIALYLFVKSSGGIICRLNINTLYRIYHKLPIESGNSFKTFLSNCLNQRESIDSEILKKNGGIEFQINKEVENDFSQMNNTQFIDKYCEKAQSKKWEIKREYLSTKKLDSILYFFFLRNFKIFPDDYLGKYFIIQ